MMNPIAKLVEQIQLAVACTSLTTTRGARHKGPP